MNTPKTAPDFGEPWIELNTWNHLQTEAGKTILYNASDMNEPYRSRAISCVNACAGMSDPAAEIQALREAVESIKSDARDLRKFKKFPESVESLACSILLKLSEITKS